MARHFAPATSLLFGLILLGLHGPAEARDLTFEERVKAQESIERVYYSHQTGATRPFEEALPRLVLEHKVRTYLKKSVALEVLWHTPVTSDMLRKEMDRIERGSRFPDRLEEIFAALGHDRFLIEECFGRPILVDRLTRGFFGMDQRLHADARMQVSVPKQPWDRWLAENQDRFDEGSVGPVSEATVLLTVREKPAKPRCFKADTWNDGILDDAPMPRIGFTTTWTGSLMLVWGGMTGNPNSPVFLNTGSRYDPATDTWTDLSTLNAPDGRTDHSAIWTGKELIVWGGENRNFVGPNFNRTGGRYDPSTDTWTSLSTVGAPSARTAHSAVWTGKWMVVWGGHTGLGGLEEFLQSGGRYDPVADTWTQTATTGAPVGRIDHAVAWTGQEMLIWGGFRRDAPGLPEIGGRYNPVTNRWVPMSTLNAPAPRTGFPYVWSGTELIVWGGSGYDPGYYISGGRYDPIADAWTPTSTVGAPQAVVASAAVWADDEMIVWGAVLVGDSWASTGTRYSPGTDSWRPVSSINAPAPRYNRLAIWTGDLMLVWGGRVGSYQTWRLENTGGRYDPGSDSWTPMSTSGAPDARTSHTAVWTGSTMIVWGGQSLGSPLDTGGRYDPVSDSWLPTASENAPAPRYLHTAVWDGGEMIVWGGFCGSAACGWFFGDGHRYDPNLDRWTPIAAAGFLKPRRYHTAVWTGSEMIIAGGRDFNLGFADGGRYDPALDAWIPIPQDFHAGRSGHSAVWTGEEMLLWGGTSSFFVREGARYDPRTGSWSGLSQLNQPSERTNPSVVWTGREMIVWGGTQLGSVDPNTGGRYDPATDTWSPTSLIGAPNGRGGDPAVWTGKDMIVWGRAEGCSTYFICGFDSVGGARYDPSNDTWTRISALDAPDGRFGHTAVWTGGLMIVWGGDGGGFPVNTGGIYVPDAVPQPPIVDAGPDQATECLGPGGTSVTLAGAAATCGNADSLTYVWTGPFPEQGGTIQGASAVVTLQGGRNTLTLSVTDEAGLISSDSVMVTIVDDSPPGVACPAPDPIECAAPGGTPVLLPAVAVEDSCDPHPAVGNSFSAGGADASGVYPLGTTLVQFTAVDGSGNSASCDMPVRVRDTIPPSLVISGSPMWPPNHRMAPATVAWQLSDACDAAPAVVPVSATSSEPDDAPGGADGNTTDDIQIDPAAAWDARILLRAERSADGPGRVYELTYSAADASGNSSSALGIVTVPHDLGTGPEPVLLRLEGDDTPGMAHLYWNAVPGAERYDLIRGDLGLVTIQDRTLWLGPVQVLARGLSQTSHREMAPDEVPEVGRAFFYLVQYWAGQRASGWGTESSPWPAEPTSCLGGCPGVASGVVGSESPRRR